jgi:chromosome segregation ATPase
MAEKSQKSQAAQVIRISNGNQMRFEKSFMKLLCLIMLFAGCSARKEKVEGHMFVVKRDGDTYEMGEVTVEVFEKSQISYYLAKTTADLERELAGLKEEAATLGAEQQDLLQKQGLASSRKAGAEQNYETAKDLAESERREIVSQCRMKSNVNWNVDTRPFFSASDAEALQAAKDTLAKAEAFRAKITQLNDQANQAAARGNSDEQREKLQEATVAARGLSNLATADAADTKEKLEDRQRQVTAKQAIWDRLYPEYQKREHEVGQLLEVLRQAEADLNQLNYRLPQAERRLEKNSRQLQSWPQEAPQAYFDDLPTPRARMETDAEGRFSFRIPCQGDFVLAAEAQRLTREQTLEKYFWLIRLHSDGKSVMPLGLSNDNLVTARPPGSAVQFPAP